MRFVVTVSALCLTLSGCMSANVRPSENLEFRANESLFYARERPGIDHIDFNERQPEPTQDQLRRLLSATTGSFLDWDYLCNNPSPGALRNCVIGQEQRFTVNERRAIHRFMQSRRLSPSLERAGQLIERFRGGYSVSVTGSTPPPMSECRSAGMCGIPTPPPPPPPLPPQR
jgi:hypothetical protein